AAAAEGVGLRPLAGRNGARDRRRGRGPLDRSCGRGAPRREAALPALRARGAVRRKRRGGHAPPRRGVCPLRPPAARATRVLERPAVGLGGGHAKVIMGPRSGPGLRSTRWSSGEFFQTLLKV